MIFILYYTALTDSQAGVKHTFKKKLFVLKKQFNVYKMFALYDTAVHDRLFATYSFVSMEIQVQNKRKN